MSSSEDNKALFLDFYHSESNQKLRSFVLIPWQDLYPIRQQDGGMDSKALLTVNPVALVYEVYIPDEADMNARINIAMGELFDIPLNEKIIRSKIESDEQLGERSGGSGHMADVSYELGHFDWKENKPGEIRVRYDYTLIITTEFTYYPDNPPQGEKREASFTINTRGEIISGAK